MYFQFLLCIPTASNSIHPPTIFSIKLDLQSIFTNTQSTRSFKANWNNAVESFDPISDVKFIFSIFIMLVGKNHQQLFLNDVPEVALILPFLFLPVSIEVEVSIRLSFCDDMDHRVYCVGRQEALKT